MNHIPWNDILHSAFIAHLCFYYFNRETYKLGKIKNKTWKDKVEVCFAIFVAIIGVIRVLIVVLGSFLNFLLFVFGG